MFIARAHIYVEMMVREKGVRARSLTSHTHHTHTHTHMCALDHVVVVFCCFIQNGRKYNMCLMQRDIAVLRAIQEVTTSSEFYDPLPDGTENITQSDG